MTSCAAAPRMDIETASGVYVVTLKTPGADQKVIERFLVSEADPDLLREIEAYAAHFSDSTTTELADRLEDVVAAADQEHVVPWTKFTAERNLAYLDQLQRSGVGKEALSLIALDLNPKQIRENFLERLSNAPFSAEAKEIIESALELATSAHGRQSSSRPQDRGALAHIPYVNHAIGVALLAIECGARAEVVTAALLHDVLEDTDVRKATLDRMFTPDIVGLVVAVTKGPEEDRAAFMDRVAQLQGEAKLLKCLDRYHNMIRAFSADTSEYPRRNLSENAAVYNVAFKLIPQLDLLRDNFTLLNAELEQFVARRSAA